MSKIFEGYERQYCELYANLFRECTSILALYGEEKEHKLSELKTGLDEAESLISRMDLEAWSLPPTQKATLLAKLREYKSKLNKLKREFKKVSSTEDPVASRNELMADHVRHQPQGSSLPSIPLPPLDHHHTGSRPHPPFPPHHHHYGPPPPTPPPPPSHHQHHRPPPPHHPSAPHHSAPPPMFHPPPPMHQHHGAPAFSPHQQHHMGHHVPPPPPMYLPPFPTHHLH